MNRDMVDYLEVLGFEPGMIGVSGQKPVVLAAQIVGPSESLLSKKTRAIYVWADSDLSPDHVEVWALWEKMLGAAGFSVGDCQIRPLNHDPSDFEQQCPRRLWLGLAAKDRHQHADPQGAWMPSPAECLKNPELKKVAWDVLKKWKEF